MKSLLLYLVVLTLDGAFAKVEKLDFFPFGSENGDSIVPPGDDTASSLITLTSPFPFVNRKESYLYVNINGALSFENVMN